MEVLADLVTMPAYLGKELRLADAPNIVVFLTDDHGQWALNCYGNREVHSPAMDFLAHEGARMQRAFTPSPVCSPARASFFTGLLPSQHGVHDWIQEVRDVGRAHPGIRTQVNLGQLLQQAGYQTAMIGKWHGGHSAERHPGFDRWFSYGRGQGPHFGDISFADDGYHFEHHGYQAPVIADHAIQFLKQRDRSKPFFLFVSCVDTHTPYDRHPPRLVQKFKDCTFDHVPWEEHDPQRTFARIPWTRDAEQRRELLGKYYAAVAFIDEQLGRVIDELENQKILDSSLVIYTGDHGHMNGQHGLHTKGNATIPQNFLEESILIPMVMRWPGHIPAGQVCNQTVDLCDLHQTILEAAGAVPNDETRRAINAPGRSFLPLITGQGAGDWRDAYFGEYGNARCIRTEQHKLIVRYPGPNGHFPDELYDLGQDPRETTNVLDKPGYLEIAAGLRQRLEEHFAKYEIEARSGRFIGQQPLHNGGQEPWINQKLAQPQHPKLTRA